MLIVSIGTGTSAGAKATLRVEDMTLLFNNLVLRSKIL
jgi:hypothetical protein